MVYFKDAPISPSQMEPEQLGKVQRFKGGLGAEGVLFSTFNSRDQFEHLLRLHLSRVAQRFAVSISDSGITKAAGADSEAEGDEDLGFLDHLELGGQAFEIATSSLGRMNDAMTAMNDAMTARTSEIAAVYRPDGSYEIQAMKKVAAGVAQDLNEFASRAEAEIPIFRDSYLSAVNHLCFSATMSVQDFNVTKEVLVPVRDAILAHKQGIPTVIDSVTTMKTMVTGLPRITGLFNKAKRNVAAAVEKQLEALEFARKASVEAVRLLDELIQKAQ